MNEAMTGFFLGFFILIIMVMVWAFGYRAGVPGHTDKILKNQIIYIDDQGYTCKKVSP